MLDERLIRGITAYALDDFLRFKLGKRLIGTSMRDESEHFEDAIRYLAKRPRIRRLLASLTEQEMKRLLAALEDQIA